MQAIRKRLAFVASYPHSYITPAIVTRSIARGLGLLSISAFYAIALAPFTVLRQLFATDAQHTADSMAKKSRLNESAAIFFSQDHTLNG